MKFTTLLATLLLALTPLVAEAVVSNVCPDNGGVDFLVDTPADAALIAGGYLNTTCNVTVTSSVVPDLQTWSLRAKSFTLVGAQIINTFPASKVVIVTSGDLRLSLGAVVKAREDVELRCTTAGCLLQALDSTLISSLNLEIRVDPLNPLSDFSTQGKLSMTSAGEVDLRGNTLYGGSRWQITAQDEITLHCGRSAPSCPLCDQPSLFCGGGADEFRATSTAQGANIDLAGSVLTFLSHATFESKTGGIDASDTIITARTNLQFDAKTTLKLLRARWLAGRTLRATTGSGCLPGENCIDATSARVEAFQHVIASTAANSGRIFLCDSFLDRQVGGLPNLNGNGGPNYPLLTVLYLVAQCAPLPPATIQ